MNIKRFKNLIIYFTLFFPIYFGVFSCSKNNKTNSSLSSIEGIAPTIKAVAALGQLTPSGEIRKLAAPISQFGSSPRLTEILVSEGDFVKKGTVLAIFENRKKLIADLEKKENLIKTNIQEISLKKDQIKDLRLL